jgi:hypothetical protein
MIVPGAVSTSEIPWGAGPAGDGRVSGTDEKSVTGRPYTEGGECVVSFCNPHGKGLA